MNFFTMKSEKMLQLRSLASPCSAAIGKAEAGELSSRAAGQVGSQPGQLGRVVFKKERRGPWVQPGVTEALGQPGQLGRVVFKKKGGLGYSLA